MALYTLGNCWGLEGQAAQDALAAYYALDDDMNIERDGVGWPPPLTTRDRSEAERIRPATDTLCDPSMFSGERQYTPRSKIRQTILAALREHGTMSARQITALTGINHYTAKDALYRLLLMGRVVVVNEQSAARGKANVYAVAGEEK